MPESALRKYLQNGILDYVANIFKEYRCDFLPWGEDCMWWYHSFSEHHR